MTYKREVGIVTCRAGNRLNRRARNVNTLIPSAVRNLWRFPSTRQQKRRDSSLRSNVPQSENPSGKKVLLAGGASFTS